MKDVFYEDISKKTYNSNKDYNRQLIDKIYLENTEKDVIELLNMSVIEFMKIYCSKEKIEGMKQLDEIINELEKSGENEEYINKYKISEDSLAGLSKDQIIDIVLDEMAYSWEDPSGKIHRITNRGFLIKNPNGDSSYFLSKELYERFLYLGSTV